MLFMLNCTLFFFCLCRPSPRIDDLEAAAHAFCALDWSYVQTSLMDQHKYTKNTQLANRCIESLYIVTLLEHGFGFDGQSRNVTIALDVSLKSAIYMSIYTCNHIHMCLSSTKHALINHFLLIHSFILYYTCR